MKKSCWFLDLRTAIGRRLSAKAKRINAVKRRRLQQIDAVDGRFILMFLRDPASVLRSLLKLLKPGGIVAFQEPTWKPILAFQRSVFSLSETTERNSRNVPALGRESRNGADLHRVFQEVGLPAPAVHMETALGSGPDFISICADVLVSVAPVSRQHNVPLEDLGSFATVAARIHDEGSDANKIASLIPLVGVWARKPMNA